MIFRYWYFVLLAISLASICFAFVAQYFYNLQPCELCLKQRHPYYFFIIIAFLILLFNQVDNLFMYFFIQLGSIYGIFYSVWHVGVENKLLKGPSGCSTDLLISSDTISLKEQILNKQVVSCDEIIWSFFGLSAASINTLVLVFIFIVNALYITKYYGSEKKEYF